MPPAQLPLPIIGAPLFIISNPKLVIAQCKAGVVGSMPALNARPASQLDEWLAEITETLAAWDRDHPDQPAAPFAINQIVHKSNDRLEHDMAVCAKYKVPIVITSLGARTDVNDAVHGWGGVVLHDIINNAFAHKAIEKGADGLIAVAAGAGGHAGVKSPFALVQEIREWFDGPLALSRRHRHRRRGAGGAGHGRRLRLHRLGLHRHRRGARLATPTSSASSTATATTSSTRSLFTGVHGNYLKPSIRNAGLDPDHLPESDPSKMNFGGGEGAKKAWKDIWGCGQGIGAVKAVVPVAERVAQLARRDDGGLPAAGGQRHRWRRLRLPADAGERHVRATRLAARKNGAPRAPSWQDGRSADRREARFRPVVGTVHRGHAGLHRPRPHLVVDAGSAAPRP